MSMKLQSANVFRETDKQTEKTSLIGYVVFEGMEGSVRIKLTESDALQIMQICINRLSLVLSDTASLLGNEIKEKKQI